MTPRFSLRTLAALAAGLAFATASQAEEVTLRIHHFLPAGAPIQAKVLEPWCQKVTKESANQIKCKIFPSMQLGGSAPQLYDQAKDGVVDMIWTIPGYTPGRFLVTELFELPFMMNTPEATSRALWEFQTKHNAAEYKEVKPLAFHMNGPGNFYTRSKPIQSLADFKGLKMRGATRQTTRMLSALGATPVGMALPAVPEALSKGVIDGALTPYEVVQSTRMHELTKFTTESDPKFNAVYAQVFVLAMNKAKYDAMSPELKKVIDVNSGADLSAWIGKMIHEADAPGRKLVQQANNTIHTLPVSELQNWKKATDQLDEELVAEINKRGLNGAALLKTAKELIEKSK
ncbi:TRAP transporter substrate-binding protein [Hydrogenophaga sp. NH-16]|uniref:TRAP transporter substrate-binding protein n=1 Tax=Hydrogenophaga sp. NH-16 TaxID=2184519 RepID=UPI000FD9674D|nr:TRAP transporter substrate-binding protein [Hydrogenophaga sp. NH-16]